MKSLRARLLLALCGLLVLTVASALVAADLRFREVGREARRDVLQALNLALLGVVDEDADGRLRPVAELADPRLGTPRSGLYLQVQPRGQSPTWRSGSLAGADIRLDLDVPPGQRVLREAAQADGTLLLVFAQGIAWETAAGGRREYVLVAAEDQAPYRAQLSRLRGQFLAGGALMLGVAALVVALVAGVLLQPLRRMERQIAEVETGQRAELSGEWPRELQGVAKNLNALLKAERDRAERYRQTLGNLAHSLKTPLSILRNLLENRRPASPVASVAPDPLPQEVAVQVNRMQEIVEHQLRRATAGSLAPGVEWTPVLPVVEEVLGALRKVYAARGLRLQLLGMMGESPDPRVACPLDRGDLLELVGNLADNACKFARSAVDVRVGTWTNPGWRRPGLELAVEDDGPGIAPAERERIVGRGVRLDEDVPGQGIGLAVVADLVSLQAGTLSVSESPRGGARFLIRLPGR